MLTGSNYVAQLSSTSWLVVWAMVFWHCCVFCFHDCFQDFGALFCSYFSLKAVALLVMPPEEELKKRATGKQSDAVLLLDTTHLPSY